MKAIAAWMGSLALVVGLGVGCGGGGASDSTAGSSPTGGGGTGPAQGTAWRFAVVGDTHVGTATLADELCQAILADGAKVALFPGDIVQAGKGVTDADYRAQLAAWKAAFAPLAAAGVGVYPIRGNHEDDAPTSLAAWNAAFSGAWALPSNGPIGETNLTYSVTYKNALFLGLDAYTDLHRVNQAWVDQQLAAKGTRPHVFAFAHEPAFKVFHTDCLDDDATARDAFWNALKAAGARLYFSGHDHFFDAARIDDGDGQAGNDLTQLVVGTGGGPLFTQHAYNGVNNAFTPLNLAHLEANGYLLVEVSGDTDRDLGLTLTFKQRTVTNGQVSYVSAWTTTTSAPAPTQKPYAVVGTAQTTCYDATQAIATPAPGSPWYGQDAQHPGPAPSYRDNGDGTVSDLNTGLMWVKARGSKTTWEAAVAGASACRVGGHADWRMPTIKELYSLIRYTGAQGPSLTSLEGYVPFIDTTAFDFAYGAGTATERIIDCQDWSGTAYVGTVMGTQLAAFGVNFADGRIKGYPRSGPTGTGPGASLYARYVRGNAAYGQNDFLDHGDSTITDRATGLMWAQADSGEGLDWPAALAWVQARNTEHYLGHSDWRLPNVKELQSLVEYTRAPQATDAAVRGPALDPRFRITSITAEDGLPDAPFFWSSTSFMDGTRDGVSAAYVAFGRAMGIMTLPPATTAQPMDVHGAGAQRSDPKTGDPAAYPTGRGPQGDVVRIRNFVRLVRNGV